MRRLAQLFAGLWLAALASLGAAPAQGHSFARVETRTNCSH